MATLTGLWTTDHADIPLPLADRDDRLRERGNLAGTYCDHYSSFSYSIIGCDDCWDHAYGPCRFGSCCR